MTPSLALDLALLLVLLGYALRGWRVGLVAGGLGLLGLVLGALVALWAAPLVLARIAALDGNPLGTSLLLLLAVLVGASLGQGLLGRLGHRLRGATHSRAARGVDSGLGAAASLVVSALVVAIIGVASQPVLPRTWGRAVDDSRVLGAIEDAMPGQAERWASQLTRSLTDLGFPRVFGGLAEPIIPVDPPSRGAGQSAGVQRAARSIVQVAASADACGREQSGSGWVVAPRRVVTNAHVVAGSGDVDVQVGGVGRYLRATVVAFNPRLDLAILEVPDLDAPALQRAGSLGRNDDAAVAGFPLGGDYRVDAARVRGVLSATGEDIYGRQGVTRQVYALNTRVQPGNSGGPLLTTGGRVAGTVFARSSVDPRTGYALTDRATDAMLDKAASYRTPVSTGSCSSG